MNNQSLPPLPQIHIGLYRHYTGDKYEVIAIARHSETQEPMVICRALYGNHDLWVHPSAVFSEQVLIDGVMQPRFVKVPR